MIGGRNLNGAALMKKSFLKNLETKGERCLNFNKRK